MTDKAANMKKVIVTVPGGGWNGQAVALLRAMGPRYEYTFVLGHLLESGLEERIPCPGQIVRVTTPALIGTSWISHVLRFTKCMFQCFVLVRRVRPDAIVGVAGSVCGPLLLAGRLWGARCIFIESLARTTKPSRTGRAIRRCHLSHRYYAQWPRLADACPGSVYAGRLL